MTAGFSPPPPEQVVLGVIERLGIQNAELPPIGSQPTETLTQAATRWQRWVMVIVSCSIFILLNLIVIGLISYQRVVENHEIVEKALAPADRTITSGVFMTLIGATVV